MTILEYIKSVLNIEADNDVFDDELLMFINASVSFLSQVGVVEYDDLIVDETTNWPPFINNTFLFHTTKSYVANKVKLIFDPTASATINESRVTYGLELEERIYAEINTPEETT